MCNVPRTVRDSKMYFVKLTTRYYKKEFWNNRIYRQVTSSLRSDIGDTSSECTTGPESPRPRCIYSGPGVVTTLLQYSVQTQGAGPARRENTTVRPAWAGTGSRPVLRRSVAAWRLQRADRMWPADISALIQITSEQRKEDGATVNTDCCYQSNKKTAKTMHRIWRKLWKTWPTHIDDNPSLDNGIVRLPTTLEKMCRVLVEWIAEILPECQAPLSRAVVTERVQWVRRNISQQPLCEIFSERAGKYSSERIFQLPDDNSLAGWEVIVHSCREISEWR